MRLVEELAKTMGVERARRVYDDAVRACVAAGTEPGEKAVLDVLASGGGVAAIAARSLRKRWSAQPALARPESAGARLYAREDIEKLLARSLGDETAHRCVGAAWAQLGLAPQVDAEVALTLLDRMAEEPGIVGVTARFAKARIHLT